MLRDRARLLLSGSARQAAAQNTNTSQRQARRAHSHGLWELARRGVCGAHRARLADGAGALGHDAAGNLAAAAVGLLRARAAVGNRSKGVGASPGNAAEREAQGAGAARCGSGHIQSDPAALGPTLRSLAARAPLTVPQMIPGEQVVVGWHGVGGGGMVRHSVPSALQIEPAGHLPASEGSPQGMVSPPGRWVAGGGRAREVRWVDAMAAVRSCFSRCGRQPPARAPPSCPPGCPGAPPSIRTPPALRTLRAAHIRRARSRTRGRAGRSLPACSWAWRERTARS